MLALVMTGCGGRNVKSDAPGSASSGSPAGAENKPAVKRGGYYLDDGPGDNPPADIDSIPDAVPRPEILYARASRPYTALGQRYTPMTAYAPYKQRGVASWYGKRYHGQKTSSGEVYDMYAMSGAHTILPLPSYARVTNPENGRSVIVRINDRGPFHSDRLIDLSYAAAYKLRLTNKGSGLVEVEAINAGALVQSPPGTGLVDKPALSTPAVATAPAPPAMPADMPVAAVPAAVNGSPQQVAAEIKATAMAGTYVQVGAFRNKDNAQVLINKLRKQDLVENSPLNSWYNEGIYRVRIGPFNKRDDAERIGLKIKHALSVNTYIIVVP